MFVGMDTFKDMSSSNRRGGPRSVLAFVASMDGTPQDMSNKFSCTRFFSRTNRQPVGQECACLKTLMIGSYIFYFDICALFICACSSDDDNFCIILLFCCWHCRRCGV